MSEPRPDASLAPVVLFAYMRPDHLATTVRTLVGNPEAERTQLIVFCDAAKKPEHQAGVDAVRRFATSIQGFASVTVVEREYNFGLAASIIDGVTRVVSEYGRIIVLEDDLMLSPHFLRYMNDALDRYADDDRVISIHGYVAPVQQDLPETFFLGGADCWGWATWNRGWTLFNPNGSELLDQLRERKLIRRFDLNGAYSFSTMLKDQIRGKNDSWAVRWHASAFLADKLTLHPGRSLVHNIGNDSSGTHCGKSSRYDALLSSTPINLSGIEVAPSDIGRIAYEHFFRQLRPNVFLKVSSRLKHLLRKMFP